MRQASGVRVRMVLVALLLTAAQPPGLRGQEGAFAFHLRGGGVVPTGSFHSADGEWQGRSGEGTGFGMGFTFPAPGPFGLFLGFGQRRFSCDEGVCPGGSDWISTGFDAALRMVVGKGRTRAWFQGGLHNHRLEGELLEEGGAARRITSDGGGGFELGGGLLFGIGERTSLSPGVWYGWGEVPFENRPAISLRYLMFDLGLVLGF